MAVSAREHKRCAPLHGGGEECNRADPQRIDHKLGIDAIAQLSEQHDTQAQTWVKQKAEPSKMPGPKAPHILSPHSGHTPEMLPVRL